MGLTDKLMEGVLGGTDGGTGRRGIAAAAEDLGGGTRDHRDRWRRALKDPRVGPATQDIMSDGPSLRAAAADAALGLPIGSGWADDIIEKATTIPRALNPTRLYPNLKGNVQHITGEAMQGVGTMIEAADKGQIAFTPQGYAEMAMDRHPEAEDPGNTRIQVLARALQLGGEELSAAGQETLAGIEDKGLADTVLGTGLGSVLALPSAPFAMYQENVDAALAGGATEEEARQAALPAWAASVAMEWVGLGQGYRALKAISRIKDPAVRKGMTVAHQLALASGAEGLTEGTQQLITNITQQIFEEDDFDLETLPKLFEGVGEQAKIGALAGLVLPVGLGVTSAAMERVLGEDPEVSDAAVEEISRINQAIAEAVGPELGLAAMVGGPEASISHQSGLYGASGIGPDPGPLGVMAATQERDIDASREVFNEVASRVEQAGDVLDTAAEGLSQGKEVVLDWWMRPLIDKVMNPVMHRLDPVMGKTSVLKLKATGRIIGQFARKAIDLTKSLQAEIQGDIAAYQSLVSGGPTSKFGIVESQRVRNELSELIDPSKPWTNTVFAAAVENDAVLEGLSPNAQEAVQAYRALSLKSGQMAERLGIKIRRRKPKFVTDPVTGKPQPTGEYEFVEELFHPTPGGRVLPRSFTQEMYYILKVGPSSAAFRQLAKALAVENGLNNDFALKQLTEMREQMLTNAGTFEIARTFEKFPSHLNVNGRLLPLLRSDPFQAAQAIRDYQLHRLGFASVFGQDEAMIQKMGEAFQANGGRRTDFDNLMKALQAIPLELPLANEAMAPGTPLYTLGRGINATFGVLRSMRLTMAAVANSMETLATVPAFSSWGDYAKALVKFAKHPMAKQMRQETAQINARSVDILDWGWERGRAMESMARRFGNLFKFMNKEMNEWNELISAQAGLEMAQRLREGKGTEADMVRLQRQHGLKKAEAERLMSGAASDEQYARVARRVAEQTQGTTSAPAERSRAGNSPLWGFLVPFDQYAQKTVNRTLSLSGNWVDSARGVARIIDDHPTGATWAEIKSSPQYRALRTDTAALASWVGGAGAAGALQLMLRGTAMFWVAGLAAEADEAKEDPAEFATEALKQVLFSGFIELVNRSAENNRPMVTDLGESIFPVSVIQEVINVWNGTGRYTSLDGAEKYFKALNNNTPVLRSYPVKVTFGMLGVGVTDPELDVAMIKHYDWMKKNVGTTRFESTQPSDNEGERRANIQFRTGMREGTEWLRKGDVDRAIESFRRAVGTGRDFKASLGGRRVLTKIPTRLRSKYAEDMNPKYIRKLREYDKLLEAWAGINQ